MLKSWLDEVRRAPTLRTNRPTPGRRSLVAPPLTFSSGTHVQVQAINVDVEHTVYEVQEEFSIGLGEVVRARAAEKARPLPLFSFYQPTDVGCRHTLPVAGLPRPAPAAGLRLAALRACRRAEHCFAAALLCSPSMPSSSMLSQVVAPDACRPVAVAGNRGHKGCGAEDRAGAWCGGLDCRPAGQ